MDFIHTLGAVLHKPKHGVPCVTCADAEGTPFVDVLLYDLAPDDLASLTYLLPGAPSDGRPLGCPVALALVGATVMQRDPGAIELREAHRSLVIFYPPKSGSSA